MQHDTGGPEGREQLCLDARGSVQLKPEARTQEQLLHQHARAWSSPEYEPAGQQVLLMILQDFKVFYLKLIIFIHTLPFKSLIKSDSKDNNVKK